MSGRLTGIQLAGDASEQLRELPSDRRDRVIHVLEEMFAVVEVTAASMHFTALSGVRLHFTVAGVRVEYSIDPRTGLLTVHEVAPEWAQTG